MNETTKEILKFVFVIGSLPWVLPFLRSLAKDLVGAMEEDGGLLGEPPTPSQLEEIRRRKAREPDPLVNEPLAHVREAQERAGSGGASGIAGAPELTMDRSGPTAVGRAGSIGVDYTAAPGHAPGVGRYVRELVRAAVRCPRDGQPKLVLVEVGRAPRPMEGAPLGLTGPDVVGRVERRRVRVPRRAARALARFPGAAGLLLARGCDVFHRAHPGWPPVGAVPTTTAVSEFPPAASAANEAFGAAVRSAKAVFAFSAASRARLIREYDVARERCHVVPVGSDHWERDLPEGTAPRASRDVLVLGAVRRSRQPLDVLRAFEALRATGHAARLLLVGRPGDAADPLRAALRASPRRGDVRWIDDPDEARMPRCVAGASVLLHLADDEATPVTPLEAARFGLPVVATPLPAFREALGDDARWVDGGDPAGVAAALADALEEAAAAPGARSMRESARPYTWRACAAAHLAVWDPILLGRAGVPPRPPALPDPRPPK